MFSIGQRVLRQKTGTVGEVIGYGYQLINGIHQTTIQVLCLGDEGSKVIVEDVLAEWVLSDAVSSFKSLVEPSATCNAVLTDVA